MESDKVRYARGHATLPLLPEDLNRKFLDCIAVGNPALNGQHLLRNLQNLESLPGCRSLLSNRCR